MKKEIIVQKFGGTSLGSWEKIQQVCDIIKRYTEKYIVIPVVSALSPQTKSEGTTSQLLKAIELSQNGTNCIALLHKIEEQHNLIIDGLAKQYSDLDELKVWIKNEIIDLKRDITAFRIEGKNETPLYDKIISFGEKGSARIVEYYLNKTGIKSIFTNLSNSLSELPEFTSEEIKKAIKKTIIPYIEKENCPIVTGFIGPIPGGILNTIGRGYSDYTSALIASAMNATELQIWKEVDGVMTADPSIVNTAEVINQLTMSEVKELTLLGAEVLHKYTIEHVLDAGINIRVKRTTSPDSAGTLISNIQIEKGANIVSITSTTDKNLISKVFSNKNIDDNEAVISIIGQNIKHNKVIYNKINETICSNGNKTIFLENGSLNHSISFIVKDVNLKEDLNKLHKKFFN